MADDNGSTTFDADKKMLENTSRILKIGGKDWHPAKRSGNVAKRIAALGEPPGDDTSPDGIAASMDYLYDNIAILIVDGEGNHPEREWLLDNLEWNVAQEMIGFLNPELAEQIIPPTIQPTQTGSGTDDGLQRPVSLNLPNSSDETTVSPGSTN